MGLPAIDGGIPLAAPVHPLPLHYRLVPFGGGNGNVIEGPFVYLLWIPG